MKRIAGLIFFVTALSAVAAVQLDFYFQPDCGDCREVSLLVLPQLADECAGLYELHEYSLEEEDNFLRLLAALDALGDTSNAATYIIVDGRIALAGSAEISRRLIPLVKAGGAPPQETARSAAAETRLTFFTILAAGLADGINPCVFATLVFFLSVLAQAGADRRRLLAIGGVYTLAVFLTYLLLGLGALQILLKLRFLQWWLNAAMIVFLLLLAVLSLRDAWKFRREPRARSVLLQLPDGLKRRLHRLIRRAGERRFLLPGVFALGVAVTVIESVCTGQVYVPTLVWLANQSQGAESLLWFGGLVLYNLAFIVPLAVILGAAVGGVRLAQFMRAGKTHLVIAKVAMALFFLLLALILIRSNSRM